MTRFVPEHPILTVADQGDGAAHLSWTAVQALGLTLTGYQIWRATNIQMYGATLIYTQLTRTYADTIPVNVDYWYQVIPITSEIGALLPSNVEHIKLPNRTEYLYAAGDAGNIFTIDVRTKNAPAYVGKQTITQLQYGTPFRMVSDDGILYATHYAGTAQKVFLLDWVTGRTTVAYRSTITPTKDGNGGALVRPAKSVFTMSPYGVECWNVEDPANPVVRGTALGGANLGGTWIDADAFDSIGKRIYCIEGDGNYTATRWRIAAIADDDGVSLAGGGADATPGICTINWRNTYTAQIAQVLGGVAWLWVQQDSGGWIGVFLPWANNQNTNAGSFGTNAQGVNHGRSHLMGNYLFNCFKVCPADKGGVQIFDLSVRTAVAALGEIGPTGVHINDMVVVEENGVKYAYLLAYSAKKIYTYDVTDPASPSLLHTLDCPNFDANMYVIAGRAAIHEDGGNGLLPDLS